MAVTIRDILGGRTPSIEVLDAGASLLEGSPVYTPLIERGLATVTGFEPDPDQYQRLLNERADSIYRWHPHFLGDGKKHTFYTTQAPGCMSLLKPNLALTALFTGLTATNGVHFYDVKHTTEVQTTRLDDIENLTPPDFMKFDIQGGELMALQNGTNALKSCLALHVECEFIEFYEGQPLFGDIQVFLRQHGFVFHRFKDFSGRCFAPFVADGHPYNPMSQATWSDCVFVRDFMKLNRLSTEQLLKLVTILFECYSSFDLIYHILQEHDRREGNEPLTQHYLNLLSQTNRSAEFINVMRFRVAT